MPTPQEDAIRRVGESFAGQTPDGLAPAQQAAFERVRNSLITPNLVF